MRTKQHHYTVRTVWSGATAGATRDYRSFSREHAIEVEGKALLKASADPSFRGDAELHNPEDMLVAALSSCHLLSYLALCGLKGVEVVAYEDAAIGVMEDKGWSGRFTKVTLRPAVTIAKGSDVELAMALHEEAHGVCFIANSVNFPVRHEPVITVAAD